MDARDLMLRPLEATVNRVLFLDPEAVHRLRPLVGRSLLVELSGTGMVLRAYFSERGVSLGRPDPEDPAPDARVRLSPAAILTLVSSRGEQAQGVEFRGDVGVVHNVRRLVGQLEIDWEEQLSRVMGDVLAHELGNGVRAVTGWLTHARRTFEQNLGEYLTEESRQLPTRYEVGAQLDEIDRLRADADRLEARLLRLERRFDKKGS